MRLSGRESKKAPMSAEVESSVPSSRAFRRVLRLRELAPSQVLCLFYFTGGELMKNSLPPRNLRKMSLQEQS